MACSIRTIGIHAGQPPFQVQPLAVFRGIGPYAGRKTVPTVKPVHDVHCDVSALCLALGQRVRKRSGHDDIAM